MRILAFLLVLAALGAMPALARQPAFDEWQAAQESLSCIHPRLRSRWLAERGLVIPGENAPLPPVSDSGGLRLVGKFGRGPAFEVTGQDSFVFLCLGSEVAIVNFGHPDSPRVVAEVQANGLVRQAAVRDTVLYVSAMWGGSPGVDLWSVARPEAPILLGHIPTMHQDFCVRDTFLYVTQALDAVVDTFKVYSVADPANPYLLGTCRDSGSAITVTNGAAFLADRWGLYVVDVTDPANPHRIGSYPGVPLSVEGRGNICCVTFANPSQPDWLQFEVLDVSNPAAPTRLGYLTNTGGYDMFLEDTFAHVSGYYTGGHEFKILSIADSTRPRLVGTCATPGEGWGVWVSRSQQKANFADYPYGLSVVDVAAPASPAYDTSLLKAGFAHDVSVEGTLACVASDEVGMLLLDVSDPSMPDQLGVLDSTTTVGTRTVAIKDSFAYMGYFPSLGDLHSIDISDPTRPVSAGGVDLFNRPEDIVVRDSYVFCAEARRFQVVNVARPREPVLVGSCDAGDLTRAGLVVQDSLAYFIGPFVGMQVFSVADPANPYLVNTVAEIRAAGCDVVDTLLYVGDYDDSLHIWSFADPAQPYQVSAVPAVRSGYGTAVLGRHAYVGSDACVRAFDVQDPRNPVEVGSCAMPYEIRRVEAFSGQVYVCCWDAGVAILDTFHTGVREPGRTTGQQSRGPRLLGSVVSDELTVEFGPDFSGAVTFAIYDATGRAVLSLPGLSAQRGTETCVVSMGNLPDGTYFVRVETAAAAWTLRAVKLQGR